MLRKKYTDAQVNLVIRDRTLTQEQRWDSLSKMGVPISAKMRKIIFNDTENIGGMMKDVPELATLSKEEKQKVFAKAIENYKKSVSQ